MGRTAAKVTLIVLLAILVVYVLFTFVFPRVERFMDDPRLGEEALAAPTARAGA